MPRYAMRYLVIACVWFLGLVMVYVLMRFADWRVVLLLFLLVVAGVPITAFHWCGVRTGSGIFTLTFTAFFVSIAVFVLIGIAGERLEAALGISPTVPKAADGAIGSAKPK